MGAYLLPSGDPMSTFGWRPQDTAASLSSGPDSSGLRDVAVYEALFNELGQVAAWGDDARELIVRVRDGYRAARLTNFSYFDLKK